ncbi:PIN domain-containing protein [Microbacterium sp. KUDC0406]|uniref:TA system VapC family ribonuclease toxin n=1 Tax=Microbacterium sp. KUDC0406 TaxID=2909588 RepID=UPI001F2886EE|nr:TA system VapC family ribonuclease toxin [Microbacterium sp. KUDC0406]UJP10330.1 PIN domain-containing protein [Microbacterium sp. KUDC0406]
MIVVDVNVLIAAFRQDHPHHDVALPWLSQALSGSDDIVVPDAVWTGFLRIVTLPGAFRVPSRLDEASAFIHDVVSAGAYLTAAPLIDGATHLVALCIETQATGNLVPDAYIASVALGYDCPVATFDRDFRRFDGLRIITPAA